MRLARREFLRYSGALAGIAAVSPRILMSCSRRRPNILVITADDMRTDHLPYMTQTLANFDGGTQYTSCRLNVPACQPQRVGFLTGRYARRTGVYGTADYMPDPAESIGPWLQSGGYATAVIGKYPYPFGGTTLSGWNVQRTFAGATEQDAYGYVIFDGTSSTSPPEHQTDYLFAEAQQFVTSAPRPWFCSVTPTDPHIPLEPRPQNLDDFADVEWPLVDDDLVGKPSWIQAQPAVDDGTRASIRAQARVQLQELMGVDDGVAALFLALSDTGQLANTIVIFTSDNGVMYGEHRMWRLGPATKNTPYDPSLRVPLLARGPGFGSATVAAPVCAQDITATCLAAAWVQPDVELDGIDLRTPDPDRVLLHERSGAVPPAIEGLPGGVGVTTVTRKLWRHEAEDPDRYEMYLLDADPDELVNVAYDPAYLDERNALEAALDLQLA